MNTDLGNVICGLESCRVPFTKCYDGGCPYAKYQSGCKVHLKDDALTLLKMQESKSVKDMLVVGGHLMGKCPKCYKVLTVQDHPVACGFCGQKVKWDD